MPSKIFLIIPCYNEENRLKFKNFKNLDSTITYLYVNDGSTDNTLSLLKENVKYPNRILDLKVNVGKAEAVRKGVLYIRTFSNFKSFDWIGFWDADLASPVEEVLNFIRYKQFYNSVDAIIGCRLYRLGSKIHRNYIRHIFGRIFATIISIFLKIDSYDSQCGSKIFRKNVLQIVFDEPFLSRWIFDVEILIRLKNYNVIEYPLIEWSDISGSKINLFKDSTKVILDLFRIYKKYIRKPNN